MLLERHHQFTLNLGSQYFGRVDPVRKIQIQSGETAIECQAKQLKY